MKSKRVTITLTEEIIHLAKEVMMARHFSDFSGFLQQLIREDFERRRGPLTLEQAQSGFINWNAVDEDDEDGKPAKHAKRKRGGHGSHPPAKPQ